MAHYQCEKCSEIMTAEALPEACETCGAPAAEAFPTGASAEDTGSHEPVDGLFDVTKAPPLQAVTTLELAEEDLVEGEGQPPPPPAPRLVTPSSRAPSPPTPMDSAAVKPMPGRVAYPIPVLEEAEIKPTRRRPPEQDEITASGLPPVPPRPDRPLTSQTESLSGLRARRVRRQLRRALGLGGVIAVVVGVLLIVFWPRRSGEPPTVAAVDTGAVDTGAADTGIADRSVPDLAPARDLRLPDLRARDQRAARQPRPAVPAAVARDSGPAPDPEPPTKTAEARYKDGLKLLMQGELDQAVRRLNEALRYNPRLSLAHRALGLAHEKLGRPALARRSFERYLELRPDAPDAAAIRGRIDGLSR